MEFRDTAVRSAATWAWQQFGLAGWRLHELVTHVEVDRSVYARAITRWTRRAPVWRQSAHAGRQRVREAPVVLEQVDPWSVDEAQLAQDSWHVTTCIGCDGAKNVDCSTCQGAGRVRCSECGGSGRVMSQSSKSYKEVNCKRCRGSGQAKCSTCRRGRVQCSACAGKGKQEAWIEIETHALSHVAAWPSGTHLQTHPCLGVDSEQADHWAGAVVTERVEHAGRLSDDGVGAVAQHLQWGAARMLVEPSLDPRCDRVTYQSVRCYEAPTARVHFATFGRQGSLEVLGREATPTENFDATPLSVFRQGLIGLGAAAGVLALFGTVGYLARGPFYVDSALFFALALLVTGVGIVLVVGNRWRRKGAPGLRRGLLETVGLGFVCAGALAGSLLVILVHPSGEVAASAIEDGELELARAHLEALDRSGAATEVEWVALYERKAAEAPSDDELLEILPGPGEPRGELSRVGELRREVRFRQIGSALQSNDFEDAANKVGQLRGEHGGQTDEVQERLRTSLVEVATQRLDDGKPLEAERVLVIGWNEFRTVPEYVALSERILLEQAEQADELDAKVTLIRRALDLGSSDRPQKSLDELYEARLVELGKLEQAEDEDKEEDMARLRRLAEAHEGYVSLRTLFPKRKAAIDERQAALEALRAGIVRQHPVLGARRESLVELLWPARLATHHDQVIRLEGLRGVEEAGAYLVLDGDIVRGAYLAPKDPETQYLSLSEANAFFQAMVGDSLSNKELQREGKGIKHARRTLGGHPLILGFYDSSLVEATLGKVTL